ncbi:MAG: class I SAM-dependent methyltransferase [Thermodesulfobacteriota bacterium]
MAKTQMEQNNRDFYREYYNDPNIRVWREIGACDKAKNVIDLWTKCVGGRPSLVDIGCGDGALVGELDSLNFAKFYTGMEISESGLANAGKRKYKAQCNFVLFDGCSIPAGDKSFDLAVFSHVLEHVECPRHLLDEAARIAKYVFVEVPLELNYRTPHNFKKTSVGHINLYNPLLLRHLVESSGLRVIAEQLTCPSLQTFTYKRAFWKGWLHWAIKTTLLRLSVRVASASFTYQGCLLAESQLG